jgi:hypothetical protein
MGLQESLSFGCDSSGRNQTRDLVTAWTRLINFSPEPAQRKGRGKLQLSTSLSLFILSLRSYIHLAYSHLLDIHSSPRSLTPFAYRPEAERDSLFGNRLDHRPQRQDKQTPRPDAPTPELSPPLHSPCRSSIWSWITSSRPHPLPTSPNGASSKICPRPSRKPSGSLWFLVRE